MVEFAGFVLDVADERLSKAGKPVAVRRKPMAILRYLATHPGRLVTHAELLEHVWGGSVVSESAMRSHMHELRQVLGEGVIETVIGRGYRFAAEVRDSGAAPRPVSAAIERLMVGRDHELARLKALLASARRGERQLCFVTGDPGIGKTTLVDAFVEDSQAGDVIILRGASIEQHGTPEPYAPVIEMMSSLRQSAHREAAIAELTRSAPAFLLQLSHLIPDGKVDEVAQRAHRAGEPRPITELVEAFEAIANQLTVIVVHDDVQWSDVATLDLLAMLGARRGYARLLVIATARSGEAQTITHPLNRVMRSLVSRGTATSISLSEIPETEVAHYLAARYPGHRFPPEFARIIAEITGGTPLFLVSLIDDLARRGMIVIDPDGGATLGASVEEVAAYRPDGVRQLVDIQVDRLNLEEQRVLEAAAVIGHEFSTGLVAAALDLPAEDVDDRCDGLARRELFVRREGVDEWPGGEQHTRYRFRHGLVQEVCGERATPTRRQSWHRRIAERLERAYAGQLRTIAHLLARHYDLGQVPLRALQCYVTAAEVNEERFASADALALSLRARTLLPRVPAGPERDALELAVLSHLSQAGFRVLTPMAHPLEMFERMVVLGRAGGDPTQLASALVNLAHRHATLAQYARASEVLDEVDELRRHHAIPPAVVGFAGLARAVTLCWTGELAKAQALIEKLLQGPLGFDPSMPGMLGPTNRGGMLRSFLGFVTWAAGDPDAGMADAERVHELAMKSGDPFFLGAARCHVARYGMLRGRPPAEVRALATSILAWPEAQVWHSPAEVMVAWADAHDGPLADDRVAALLRGHEARIAAFPQGSTNVALPLTLMLRAAGRTAQALTVVDGALVFARERGERILEPELLRYRGDLLAADRPAEAEAAYVEALATAIARGAHTFGLVAATRLAERWHGTARQAEGFAQLAAALGRMAPASVAVEVLAARARLAMA